MTSPSGVVTRQRRRPARDGRGRAVLEEARALPLGGGGVAAAQGERVEMEALGVEDAVPVARRREVAPQPLPGQNSSRMP